MCTGNDRQMKRALALRAVDGWIDVHKELAYDGGSGLLLSPVIQLWRPYAWRPGWNQARGVVRRWRARQRARMGATIEGGALHVSTRRVREASISCTPKTLTRVDRIPVFGVPLRGRVEDLLAAGILSAAFSRLYLPQESWEEAQRVVKAKLRG